MCMKIFTWNIDLNGYVENKNTKKMPILFLYVLEKL